MGFKKAALAVPFSHMLMFFSVQADVSILSMSKFKAVLIHYGSLGILIGRK